MKKCKFFSVAFLAATLMLNVEYAHAAGDFRAIELKKGHAGMSFGDVDFTGNDITVEMWLNLEHSTFTPASGILSNMGAGNQGFLMGKRTASPATNNENTLRFFVKPLSGTNNVDLRISLAEVTEKWTHVAFVVSSADNKGYIYVNGEPYINSSYTIANFDVATGGFKGNTSGRITDVKLGSLSSEAKPNGRFADLRIWSVARTAEEIKANFNHHLEGEQDGLFVNFVFDEDLQTVKSYGWADRPGTLNPTATWESVFAFETLAKQPTNLALSDKSLVWDNNDGTWVVNIYKKEDNTLVNTSDSETHSVLLTDKGLANGVEYCAKVKTINNGFHSGWATSTSFSFSDLPTDVKMLDRTQLLISVEDGTLVVFSETTGTLRLITLYGQTVRQIKVTAGKTVVDDLAPGVYFVNNTKVVIPSK